MCCRLHSVQSPLYHHTLVVAASRDLHRGLENGRNGLGLVVFGMALLHIFLYSQDVRSSLPDLVVKTYELLPQRGEVGRPCGTNYNVIVPTSGPSGIRGDP
jgi:hypothetical protein